MGTVLPTRKTYALGVVSRLTGLSADVIRAWERRYAAVEPERSAGGTRRYSEADVSRLHLLAEGVRSGHAIGEIADLDDDTLRELVEDPAVESRVSHRIDEIVRAVEALDHEKVEQLLGLQLAAIGPAPFARDVALPLMDSVGNGWTDGIICIAAEHMVSATLRTLLGTSLRALAKHDGPGLILATPEGERHEFGLLTAALVAAGSGAQVIYLGTGLPVAEMLTAATRLKVPAVALSIATLPAAEAERSLRELRAGLEDHVQLWVGGRGVSDVRIPPGTDRVADFDELERKIGLMRGRR